MKVEQRWFRMDIRGDEAISNKCSLKFRKVDRHKTQIVWGKRTQGVQVKIDLFPYLWGKEP